MEVRVEVAAADEESESGTQDVPDPQPDQEKRLVAKQQQELLRKSLALLPADERLLLQLRFEHDLSLEEVARLCAMGDGQRVHRKLQAILKKIRSVMGEKKSGKSEARPCNKAGAQTCQTPTPLR